VAAVAMSQGCDDARVIESTNFFFSNPVWYARVKGKNGDRTTMEINFKLQK